MKKILVVIDMQNDFIDGPLGTPEAVAIVDKVCDKIREGEWDKVYATMDIHGKAYLDSQEGKKLPVEHCIIDTDGCEINNKVFEALDSFNYTELHKETFGFHAWPTYILDDLYYGFKYLRGENIELTLVGVCTDICVISNALLLKAHYPEMKIVVDASCCAGTTPEKHRMALEVMKSCQVDVVNEFPSYTEYYKALYNEPYNTSIESEE